MTINETSILLASLSFLIGAVATYLVANFRFARQLSLNNEAKAKVIDELRVTNDGRIEQVRAEATALIERTRVHERAAFKAELAVAYAAHENALNQTVQKYESQLKKKTDGDLSVTLYPIVKHERKSGYFNKETKIEIGHSYQLFVRGIPCFAPHEVIVERTTEKELDEQRLEQFREKAFTIAEMMLSANTSGIASKVITVAKTVVKKLN